MQTLLYAIANYRKEENPIWIIWGSGQRGLALLKYIKKLNMPSIYFADNNMQKWGKEIEGIKCISEKEVEKISDQSIILSSPYRDYDLYENLSNKFLYVIPDIILEILQYYPKANGFDGFMPLGHYYSLYPNMDELKEKYHTLYYVEKEIKDIELNVEMQYVILEKMKEFLPSIPKWKDNFNQADSKYRYQTNATAFCMPDAICLHLMLRLLQPKRLIEVGSGWSSAVTLDTNEFYLNNELKISFIEPYPYTLNQILRQRDNCEIKNCGLEDVQLSYFEQLEKGDILFVDSTHVSKMGSDVNYLFFEILPRLKKGVYIHFHDIFYPFEYPKDWIEKEGYIWNELYMIRAFLMNNKDYKILFFFDYLSKMHKDKLKECLQMTNASGGSLWIEKI